MQVYACAMKKKLARQLSIRLFLQSKHKNGQHIKCRLLNLWEIIALSYQNNLIRLQVWVCFIAKTHFEIFSNDVKPHYF